MKYIVFFNLIDISKGEDNRKLLKMKKKCREKNKFFRISALFLFMAVLGSLIGIKNMYPIKYYDYVSKYSKKYEVDEALIYAVIKAESNFDESAVSNKEAIGLMQIIDSTGEWIASQIGIKDFNTHMLYDPEINIEFGTWYLANLDAEFKNKVLVLAAYNAGRGNVKKWLLNNEYSIDGNSFEKIPYKETENYIQRVNRNHKIYRSLIQASIK